MPFRFETPPNPGSLLQGELLSDIWEHRPLTTPVVIPEGTPIDFDPIHHPLMIVMTAVCDLEQDYGIRFPDPASQPAYVPSEFDNALPQLVQHTLLCDVFTREEIRPRFTGMTDIWRRIERNQDERYHHFESAPIGASDIDLLTDLYLDFKRSLTIWTANVYQGIRDGGVKRIAVVPPVYLHDLMHRYYGFLARVGLPE